MWQQRARVLWLQNGDRNKKIFHGTTTQRKRKNFSKGCIMGMECGKRGRR